MVDFETGSLSPMEQDPTDDQDWEWNDGPTVSSQTGPQQGNKDKGYAFFESSDPVRPGDKARWAVHVGDLSALIFYFSLFLFSSSPFLSRQLVFF